MIDKPRVSEKILDQRKEYTQNFPEHIVKMQEPVFPTMLEAVALVRDLSDAREELKALSEMIVRHSCVEKSLPPALELAYDILQRYGWGERVGV